MKKALRKPLSGLQFCLPHKPVVREAASATKMRVVYNASNNECTQLQYPDTFARRSCKYVCVNPGLMLYDYTGSHEGNEVETYRFTRVLFGLTPSPFLLNAALEAHHDTWQKRCPDVVAELRTNNWTSLKHQTSSHKDSLRCDVPIT